MMLMRSRSSLGSRDVMLEMIIGHGFLRWQEAEGGLLLQRVKMQLRRGMQQRRVDVMNHNDGGTSREPGAGE